MSRTHTKVYQALDPLLKKFGFVRKGAAWWCNARRDYEQCIHLHKFTFTTAFRVHAAIHPACDAQDWIELNGPNSSDGWAPRKILGLPLSRYSFEYAEDDSATWRQCAGNIAEFVENEFIPWFASWQDVDRLIDSPNSPLTAEMKDALRRIREGETNREFKSC